jgi:hypothetical protein
MQIMFEVITIPEVFPEYLWTKAFLTHKTIKWELGQNQSNFFSDWTNSPLNIFS